MKNEYFLLSAVLMVLAVGVGFNPISYSYVIDHYDTGKVVEVPVSMHNNGNSKVSDVRMNAFIYDLGYSAASTTHSIPAGDNAHWFVELSDSTGLPAGEYLVGFYASNSKGFREVRHSWIVVE